MRGETVPERVWVHVFLYSRSLGSFLTRIPNRFRIDRLIPAVMVVAWKQPGNRSSTQAVTMCTEFFEQLHTEHDIAIFATLATLDTNHHALAIDVSDFQVCQFSASCSGSVERHQQSAMVRSQSCVDKLRRFFLAKDRWQAKYPFRIRSLGNAPRPLQRLDVEESQSRQMSDNRIRRQFPLLK